MLEYKTTLFNRSTSQDCLRHQNHENTGILDTHMNVRGIEDSNIVITSNCVHARCSKIFVRDCWCCPGRVRKCWKDEASCNAICPRPPHLPPK
ncbi:hypothetical protein HID58_034901 [Brassica napus]|uniref:Embryo surrounding factor 1 brassicaceae domain-containing protein n=1 Tax=Brassica napus TaxID=3708 RepID=A0ABQ8C3D7_BRANA|nr:hypothetical protein HID58_034901 [Brassica napus]